MDDYYKFSPWVREMLDPAVFCVEDETTSNWARIGRVANTDENNFGDMYEKHFVLWVIRSPGG